MVRLLRLSYTLSSGDVMFPGTPAPTLSQVLSVDAGDRCNAWMVTLFNHSGTHLDFPRHYHAGGRRPVDYPLQELVFTRPRVVSLAARGGEAIDAPALAAAGEVVRDADILLLRSGHSALRGTPAYADGPYLTPAAAQILRRMFPRLSCIGLDWLSVTHPERRVVGDEVHRILLADAPDSKPVLILEDLDLRDSAVERLTRLIVAPLYVEHVDSVPCTVIGETADA